MKNTLLIIDGNAILHRTYHALPRFINSKGQLVNAVYGFASILLKALKDINPRYIVATFDLKPPTFRHKIFKDYKAKRIKAPQELYDQLPIIKELLKAFNIPIFEKQGFEADDIIGTIAKKHKSNIILTGDLDTLQLVNQNTKVLTGLKNLDFYDQEKIDKRYGLKPEQIVDFKALKGDASDNIPGVSGIGEKTAIDLLKNHKNLENIYENLDEIKQSTRDKLEQGEKLAWLSQKLATINCQAPIRFKLDKCLTKDYNKTKVINFLRELGFRSLIRRLERG